MTHNQLHVRTHTETKKKAITNKNQSKGRENPCSTDRKYITKWDNSRKERFATFFATNIVPFIARAN